MRPYLTSFRHALVDLAASDDGSLSADIRLDAYLKAMKYARRADLPRQLRALLIAELPTMDIVVILQYINAIPASESRNAIQMALHSLESNRREAIMERFSDQFEEKGRAEGTARALVRLLEKRFGPMPSDLRQRVSASDVTTIETWFDRALEAPELQRVFEPEGTT